MVRKEYVVEEVGKMMNKLSHIRNIAIVAHVDHGKCISGDARLVLGDGRVVDAEELYAEIERQGTAVKLDENEQIYSAQGISAFSLNKNEARVEQKRITHAWKLRGGRMTKVRLRNGAQIATTPEHKYIVLEGMGFAGKEAGQLQVGDAVVCPKNLEIASSMDMKEEVMKKLATDSFYVYLEQQAKEEIAAALKEKGIDVERLKEILGSSLSLDGLRFCFYKGRFRASDYIGLCSLLGIPLSIAYDAVKEISYRGGNPHNSKNCKPMRLPQDFAGLFFAAGLLFGDGCGDKLVVGKPELGKKYVEILEGLGITPYYRNYSYRTPEIGAGCKTLLRLLGALFGYPQGGKKSHKIRASDFLFRAPDELVAQFLSGYFDCDGTVESARRAVSISSASGGMLRDVQLLLLRFNCASILQGNDLYVTGNSVKRFNEKIGFSLVEKAARARKLEEKSTGSYVLDVVPLSKDAFSQIKGSGSMASIMGNYYEYASGKSRPTVGSVQKIAAKTGSTLLGRLCEEELAFIEVVGIEESEEHEVYDFTVEDNHNFVAEGMFIHNTTMTDSLVARAGLISKELAGEQRVMDFDEQEQARGITIKAANISLGFNFNGEDYLINLIDTPGHVDFGGHVTRAMRAVDGIVLVVDSVEGIMPQTETVLRQALKEKAKPTIFINKIDRLINELQLDSNAMTARFTKIILGLNKIIEQYAPEDKREDWRIEVQKGNIAFGTAFHKWALSVKSMTKFNIKFSDMYEMCKRGDHKQLVEKSPLDEVLLGMVIEHLPTPLVAQKYRIPVIWKGDMESKEGKWMSDCDSKGKIIGVCVGVVNDEHAGEVAVVRLFSGTVKKGDMLFLASRLTREKVQQCAIYMGADRVMIDNVLAGNIVGIVGLRDVYVGETVSEEQITPFEQIKHYAEPVVTKSIEAKDSKDLAKLILVLRAISKEDPTLKVEINQETGEHLISGMGELHLEIIEYKITKEKGVNIVTTPPIVVYRETILGGAGPIEGKSPNKHTKLKFVIEPLEKGVYDAMVEGKIPDGRPKGKALVETLVEAGMERDSAKAVLDIYNKNMLINETRGIQYLNEIMELLIQGFEEAMQKGPLAKEKVVGVKVKLVDATIHEDPVHRGPAQIIPATKRPIYAGMLIAGVTLQEPKQKVTILVPQEYMGNVITLTQGRRSQMVDIQQEGEGTTVIVKMPVAEMFGFGNDLRSASQGRAIPYQEYAGYEPLPRDLLAKVVKQIRERKGDKPDPPTPEDFLE